MDFKLSPTEEAFRDGLRAWLEAHCPREWEKTRQALGSPEARAEFLIDWQRRLHAAGYVGLHWPIAYRGPRRPPPPGGRPGPRPRPPPPPAPPRGGGKYLNCVVFMGGKKRCFRLRASIIST